MKAKMPKVPMPNQRPDSYDDWLQRMDAEVEIVARTIVRKPLAHAEPSVRTKWVKAPLRKIIARYPEGDCMSRERLECGHWHTAYEWPGESTARRRRCHDCLAGRPSRGLAEL